ncbi:uncharacterized protein LOC117176771 [Belonocnema kinseyi]|uniref:uncharacterized protein LOC117176771 n=1 Tax=Belonocnema kinseyi TaxID=2817044 RepID=UPI00143DAC96|nr:uncharacterized protein LOC117176771 [Belonocnema kinseyi]
MHVPRVCAIVCDMRLVHTVTDYDVMTQSQHKTIKKEQLITALCINQLMNRNVTTTAFLSRFLAKPFDRRKRSFRARKFCQKSAGFFQVKTDQEIVLSLYPGTGNEKLISY